MMSEKILISACLAGFNCKYSGGNNLSEEVRKLYESGRAVPVCPEQLGGLSTPRRCSEIRDGRVFDTEGNDVTEYFEAGALKALAVCRKNGCQKAILKEGSPSCGTRWIYDGTFSHTRIPGRGIFAAMLEQEGTELMNEEEYGGEI